MNYGYYRPGLPFVVKNLIIINAIVFVATMFAQNFMYGTFSLFYFTSPFFKPFQLITYMFMHANFQHIFFNMFAVWMFGRTLENVWGPKRFLFYYILCGIGAGLIQEAMQYIEYVVSLSQYDGVDTGMGVISMAEYLNLLTTVGASGAVYAILLAFGMLFPNSEMFIFPIPMPIKAKYFVIGYAVLELVLGISGGDGVAHFAHLGGMLFGFILIIYWRKKNGGGQQIYY